jgi:serine-type D-Ala-D-Ala carboxypeptidase (penicillin-binding protein 5/6)
MQDEHGPHRRAAGLAQAVSTLAVSTLALITLVLFTLVLGTAPVAVAGPPAAPRPTSSERSPSAPDPHPPAGGRAPNGSVPGGPLLAGRGLVLPAGAPALPKGIRAHGWILADLDSGAVLAARDPHGRYQPASILKSLTALSVLPNLPGRRLVTVTPGAAASEGSAVGLLPGARYSVDQLFGALLLVSANDAAAALAQANGGIARTVAAMNAQAGRLGAYDTFVQTPSGLDGWQQLTSAYDMALILRAFLNQPRLVGYDRLLSASFPPKRSKYGRVGAYQFDNQSQNFLTTVPGALVVKSGYTDAARHTYLAAASRHGRRLGVILLRDERRPMDQFQQAGALLNWGYALKAGIQPVGVLAGPIAPDAPVVAGAPIPANPAATAGVRGSAAPLGGAPLRGGAEAAGRTGRTGSGARWTRAEWLQVSVLIGGGLWLGSAFAARRGSRRRGPHPR